MKLTGWISMGTRLAPPGLRNLEDSIADGNFTWGLNITTV